MTAKLLEQFRAFGGWQVAHGMPKGPACCSRHQYGNVECRYPGLLPAGHQGSNLLLQRRPRRSVLVLRGGIGRVAHAGLPSCRQ
jgi:hypothetical protein